MFTLDDKVASVLKKYPYNISFRVRDNIVFLQGEVDSHMEWVEIGLSIGRIRGVEGVVNKIRWRGASGKEAREEWRRRVFEEKRNAVVGEYDVVIIGGGVVGAALARELSKYELKTARARAIHQGWGYKPYCPRERALGADGGRGPG